MKVLKFNEFLNEANDKSLYEQFAYLNETKKIPENIKNIEFVNGDFGLDSDFESNYEIKDPDIEVKSYISKDNKYCIGVIEWENKIVLDISYYDKKRKSPGEPFFDKTYRGTDMYKNFYDDFNKIKIIK